MRRIIDLIIEKSPSDIVTDTEIKVLLGAETSDNSRFALVKRAIGNNELLQLKRGLYCLAKKYRRTKLNLYEIADKIYHPSYISLESALQYHGLIPEAVKTITSVTTKRSKEFNTVIGAFVFFAIPVKQFHLGISRIENNGVYLLADPLKALLDYAHVYKKQWSSIDQIEKDLRLDSSFYRMYSTKDIATFKNYYTHKRAKTILKILEKKQTL